MSAPSPASIPTSCPIPEKAIEKLGGWYFLPGEKSVLAAMDAASSINLPGLDESKNDSEPIPHMLAKATKEQLAALSFLPSGMVHQSPKMSRKQRKGQGGLGKGGGKSKVNIVVDGRTVGKLYNPVAGRPYPALSSLEQGLTVTLSLSVSLLTTSVTVPVYGSNYFTLSQCPSVSPYTALFDQYKIEQIECWIEPLSDTTAVATCVFASCIDLDDANTPATLGDVADRQGALVATSLVGRYHRWKPHVAVATYSGAFTSFMNIPAPWIDVASPSVQHYGLKLATGGADGATRQMNITVRATVSFRSPAI